MFDTISSRGHFPIQNENLPTVLPPFPLCNLHGSWNYLPNIVVSAGLWVPPEPCLSCSPLKAPAPREAPGLQSSTDTCCTGNLSSQTPLVVQWFRIHLPVQGTAVWAMVWETLHVGQLAPWHHCWAPVPRHRVQRVFAWMNALLNTGQKKATKAARRNSKKRRLINHLHLPNSYPELRPGASLGTNGGHRSENASFPKWDVKPSPTKRVPRMITERRKAVIQ